MKLKLESVQAELDGIKRMIQKNAVAKDNTIDLIDEEENETEVQSLPSSGSLFLNMQNNHNDFEDIDE